MDKRQVKPTEGHFHSAGRDDAAGGCGLDGILVCLQAGADVVALLASGDRGGGVRQALASTLGDNGRVDLGGDKTNEGGDCKRVLHIDCC